MLVWSIALLTERAAVLGKAVRPDVLPRAQEGLNFLRKVAESDKNYRVQELARIGVIDSNARLFSISELQGRSTPIKSDVNGPFDYEGRWQAVYALVTDNTLLPMLLFLADHHRATIAEAVEEFKRTYEDTLKTAEILIIHGLISRGGEKLTITERGVGMVKRLRQSQEHA
jgi:hypothetical protein